jgi:thiol:disulfide interchange protein DsbD
MRYLLSLIFAFVLAVPAWGQGAVVTTEHVRAELLVHAPDGFKPGAAAWVGLAIKHKPGWHTYWRNPGDSGLPITLDWKLPAAFKAGEIEWPVAKAFPIGPMTNYGYDGEVLLPVPLTITSAPSGANVQLKLHAEWLVCEEICIPEDGDFSISIPNAPVTQHGPLFESSLAKVPRAIDSVRGEASVVQPLQLKLDISGLPAAFGSGPLRVMVEEAGVIEHAGAVKVKREAGKAELTIPVSPQRSASPDRMHAVLVAEESGQAVRLAFAVKGGWAPATAPAPATPPAPSEAAAGLLLTLVLAFAGGALLNLMPCVFPVLSLKVLGFTQHADDRRRFVSGGLSYTAGVVLSFLALAAVLLLLRQGGAQLGWGFQLQSPLVIAALAVLFTLIGLNLAGLFEFGGMLPSGVASLRASNPAADDFLSGVLAVAVASPCTAPFMGAAVGAAVFRPTHEALLIFASIGLGMAAPYLLASLSPRFAALLPRPGAWMIRFKQLMAFPMFATVIWLLWVIGHQVGTDGMVALLAALLALACALYLKDLGKAGMAAGVVLLAATTWWAMPSLEAQAQAKASAAGWQAWSPEAVEQARQQGRPVFVDFTAAWCITCQVNKRMVLNGANSDSAFASKNVLTLRADWTARDPAISAELARLGRNGVPVYALYSPGNATPVLLPEILTIDEVRKAVASLPGP